MPTVKIAVEAYNSLEGAKKTAIKKAKRENNLELVKALQSMGIGSFAGWLIIKEIEKLKEGTLS